MPKLLVLLLLACHVSTAVAQVVDPRARPPHLKPQYAHAVWAVPTEDMLSRSREPLGGILGPGDEDHRYTGFFAGAALGLFATVYALSLCEAGTSCSESGVLLGGVVASTMTGLAGAVLGGLIPK